MLSWSSKSRKMLGVLLTILVVAGTLPSGALGESEGAAPPVPLLDVYFDEGALSLEPPTATDSKRHQVIATTTTPHTTFTPPLWGSIEFPLGFTFTTDTVASFWIEPEEATIITSMRVDLRKGDEIIAQGSTGRIAGTSGENVLNGPRKMHVSIPTQGLEFEGKLDMRILYWGTGVAGTPTTVYVLYGSENHPSRLSFGVAAADTHLTPTGNAATLYLDDEGLTPIAPVDEESKTRTHGVAGVANLATSSAFTWGTFTTDRDLELVGDTTLTFWLTHDGDPAVMRTVRPALTIGGTEYTTSGGVDVWSFTEGQSYRFSIGFNTMGAVIPAGTEMKLDFFMWSTSSGELGAIEYLYGSTTHPARLTLRAAGAPETGETGLPAVSLALDSSEVQISPGSTAELNLALATEGTDALQLTISASTEGDATIEYPHGAAHTLSGNETLVVPVTLRVGTDALMNTSFNVTFQVILGESILATQEVVVLVVAPVVDNGGDDSTDTTTNTTGSESGPGLDDESAGIPAPGVVMVLLALLGLLVASRRRQSV